MKKEATNKTSLKPKNLEFYSLKSLAEVPKSVKENCIKKAKKSRNGPGCAAPPGTGVPGGTAMPHLVRVGCGGVRFFGFLMPFRLTF